MSSSIFPTFDVRDAAVRLSSPPAAELRARLREVEATLARKELELRETRESLERYRAVAQNLPNAAVMLFDHDLRFVLVEGRGLLEDIGLDAAKMIGRMVREVSSPENAETMVQQFRSTIEGRSNNFEVARNGRTISIHTTSR